MNKKHEKDINRDEVKKNQKKVDSVQNSGKEINEKDEKISKEQETLQKMEIMTKKFVEMQNKLEETENRLKVSINQNVRLQADFDNFRRRTRENEENLTDKVQLKVLKDFLPLIDNCELALKHMESKDASEVYLEGYKLLHKQLMKIMDDLGVKEIDAKNKPFDPYFHEAVMQVTSDELDSDYVAGVFQKGYMYKDKVLRPSKVQVVQND